MSLYDPLKEYVKEKAKAIRKIHKKNIRMLIKNGMTKKRAERFSAECICIVLNEEIAKNFYSPMGKS